jgi:hypothetical protein
MSHPRCFDTSSVQRCAVVVNGSLAVLLACLWAHMAIQGLFWKADFSASYTGWSMVLDGQSGRLYDLDLQNDYQHRILPEKPADEGLLPFVYPPHMAATLAPLALMPRPLAFAVWTLFQVGLCIVAGRLLWRLQADQPVSVRWLTLLTALAFPPLFVSFQMGQISLWCLVCLLGFVCALKERQPTACALWIVAGTIKPQLMVVPFVVLLGLRRWRELALAVGLLAVWFGLTTLLLGTGCWLDFLAVLRVSSQAFGTLGTDPLAMYNLKGLLTAVLGVGQARLIIAATGVAWLAGLLLILWLWRNRDALNAPDFAGRLALTFLAVTIVNPHVFPADVLVLVLPAVLFANQLRAREDRAQWLVFAGLALSCPLLFLVDCYVLTPSGLGVHPFFLLMLGVAVWMTMSLGLSPEQLTSRLCPAARPSPGFSLFSSRPHAQS